MFSRFRKSLCLLLFTTLSSCSYFFKEQIDEKPVLNTSGSQGCVLQANQTVANFFKPEFENFRLSKDLEVASQCYENTVDLFLEKVKSDTDSYSSRDIQNVLETVFSEYKDSEDFIRELLQIKSVIVGGDSARISREELKKIKLFLSEFTNYLNEILISRKYIILQPEEQISEGEFEDAIVNLKHRNEKFYAFIKTLQAGQNVWVNLDLKIVLEKIFPKVESERSIGYWNLFKSFALMMQNSSGFNHFQAPFLFESTLDIYEQYMRFYYFVKEDKYINHIGKLPIFPMALARALNSQEVFKGYRFKQFKILFDNIESRINLILKNHPSGLDYEWVRNVLFSLDELGTFKNGNLQRESVDTVLRSVVIDYLQPKNILKRDDNITYTKVKWYFDIFRSFARRQDYINYKFRDGLKKSDLLSIKSSDANSFIKLIRDTNLGHWKEDNSLDISKFNGARTFRDLCINNLVFTMAEFFMRPFAMENTEALDLTINAAEAQKIYEMIRPVGLDLRFVDARINNSGVRTFNEANLFMSVSKDFQKLDIYEGFELFQIMISTSVKYDEFHNRTSQKCFVNEFEVLGRRPLFTDCFREDFPGYMESVLGIQGYRRLESKEKSSYVIELERSGRYGLYFDDPMTVSEGRTLFTVAMYTDVLFFRFDTNDDGILKGEELVNAMTMFVPFVKGLFTDLVNKSQDGSKKKILNYFKNSDFFAHKLIAYLARNGHMPAHKGLWFDFTEFTSLVFDENIIPTNYYFWIRKQWFDEIDFNRTNLVKVVAGVSDFGRENKWRSYLSSMEEIYSSGKNLSLLNEDDLNTFVYQFECVNNIIHPEKGTLFIKQDFKDWLLKTEKDLLSKIKTNNKAIDESQILAISRELSHRAKANSSFRNYCYPPIERMKD